MTEPIKNIRENLNAPQELIEAVKKGEHYVRTDSRSIDRRSRHAKRLATAIAAYICLAVLIVGGTTLLSNLLKNKPSDKPSDNSSVSSSTHESTDPIPSNDPLTPEALYEKWLTADGVIVTVTNALTGSEYIYTYTFSGSLVMCENDYTTPTYFDFEHQKQYSKLPDDDAWTVADANYADRNELAQNSVLLGLPWFFEDNDYELKDGKYVFTDRAIRSLTNEFEQTAYYESIILMVGDPYTIEITLEERDEGGKVSYVTSGAEGTISTVIDIQFVNTTVTLPSETKPYEPDPVTPDALYEVLNNSSDITVRTERMLIQNGRITEQTAVYERDGNKVKLTEHRELAESVRYIDMTSGLEYYASEDGWLAKGSGHTYFDSVMNDYIFGIEPKFLFDSGNYAGGDGEYTMTDEASAALSAKLSGYWEINETFGDSVEASTVIVHYSDGVTESWRVEKFIWSKDGAVNESTVYWITFGDTSVTLPDERDADEIDTDRLLSPAEFRDALYGDADMTVYSEEGAFRRSFVRDGDKVRVESPHYVGEQVYFLPTAFIDLGADKVYTEGEEWDVKSQQADWQSVVDAGIFSEVWESFSVFGCYIDVMFADVNFTLKDGRYVAKEAFQKQCLEEGKAHCEFWFDEDPTYEIFFAYEDGAQIFTYRFFTADGELADEMILTLTFGDRTVEMPA